MGALRELLTASGPASVVDVQDATRVDLDRALGDARVTVVTDLAPIDRENVAMHTRRVGVQVLILNGRSGPAGDFSYEFDRRLFERCPPWGRFFEVYGTSELIGVRQAALFQRHGLRPRISDLPYRVQIYDRDLAFLSRDFEDNRAGAYRIEQPELITSLRAVFLHHWRWSRPALDPSPGTDALAIVRLMASGLTDEAAARRLGVSLRTYRRRVADLLAQLGSVSRFDAGAVAARRGLIALAEATAGDPALERTA